MFRKLSSEHVESRFFHKAGDASFLASVDEVIFGPPIHEVTRAVRGDDGLFVEKTFKVPASDRFLTFVMTFGKWKPDVHYPKTESSWRFKESGDRWYFGDYMPAGPAGMCKAAPFSPDDDVFFAAMAMTHDGVCDVPAMSTLFLEGEMCGDIENVCLIMAYDLDQDTFRKLDELGVMFLYDDSGGMADDDFEPYFPPRCMYPTHDGDAFGDISVECTVPVPILGHFTPEEITSAYGLAAIFKRFPELEDVLEDMGLQEAWEMLEDGFCFSDEVPTIEEIDKMDKESWDEFLQRREEEHKRQREEIAKKRAEKAKADRASADKPKNKFVFPSAEDMNEQMKARHEEYLSQQRKRALVDVFEYVVPLAQEGMFVVPRFHFRKIGYLKVWKEILEKYPITFRYDKYGYWRSSHRKERFSCEIQEIGRALGIDKAVREKYKSKHRPDSENRPIPRLSEEMKARLSSNKEHYFDCE